MIISDLYQTNITCSTYNATIDSGDGSTTVTVTVKLEDFNKKAVSDKSVTLTVNKGYFKSVTGTNTTNYSNTTTQSVSAKTKSDGTITAVYVPSDWGLATFSANNTKIQSNVTGLKKIKESTNGVLQLWQNGNVMTLRCWSNENNVTFSTDWAVYSAGFIPLGYRPKSAMMVTNVARIDTYWKIDADTGDVSKRTSANNPASNIKSWAMFTWSI